MDKFDYNIVEETSNIQTRINNTTTEDLFKERGKQNIYYECEKLLSGVKSSEDLRELTVEQKETFKLFLEGLQGKINNSTMMKVIPAKDISGYINFEFNREYNAFYSIIGSMARSADIKNIIKNKGDRDIIETLYDCLRLDYPKSCFTKQDEYIGIIETKMPKFSLRTPISEEFDSIIKNENKIVKNYGFPFTGIGFTANRNGIPEFYVSISTNPQNEGAFPLEAFDIQIYVVSKKRNDIFKIASYNSEVIFQKTWKRLFDKFEWSNGNGEVIDEIKKDLNLQIC